MAKFRFKVLDGVHVEEGFPTVTSDDCPYCDGSGKRKNGLPCRLCVGVVANMSDAELTRLATDLSKQTGIVVPKDRAGMLELLGGKRYERTEVRFRARSPFDPEDYLGDIIETDTDLSRFGNPKGCPPKFLDLSKDHNLNELERLRLELAQYKARHGELPTTGPTPGAGHGAPPPGGNTPTGPDFERMSMKQLREYADDNEINLGQVKSETEIRAILKKARPLAVA